ncbi:MAG TPA: hypothetical protein VJ826_05815 [Candidatus Polarisedimenticolaceae bacterium]|nr:hypothetical protein [Candidatus Polarisedimenticolaceae bacterium]
MLKPLIAIGIALLAALPPPDGSTEPPMVPPVPSPPPAPTEEGDETDPAYMSLLPDDGTPWGLPPEMADKLGAVAETYLDYAVRFACTESVRRAKFSDGEAKKETNKRYGYILERGDGRNVGEYRQKLRGDGSVTDTVVNDAEAFPPAYAWVFLFARVNQPFFAYRERGDRFEGYDWVRIFEFKGAVPYTDGRDIRQWDGVVLVDATTLTPVEIRAEPSRQAERLKLLFDRWAQSFNIIGFRTGPKPEGFSGRVLFQTRRDKLTFPTELRYTSFRAVSPKKTEPTAASTREYADYKFFEPSTKERPNEVR